MSLSTVPHVSALCTPSLLVTKFCRLGFWTASSSAAKWAPFACQRCFSVAAGGLRRILPVQGVPACECNNVMNHDRLLCRRQVPTFRADPLTPSCDTWCEFPVSDRPNAVAQFLRAARRDPSMIKARAAQRRSWCLRVLQMHA